MENKPTFWQYLKLNQIWLYIGFLVICIGFMGYWVATAGFDESEGSILLTITILTFVTLVLIVGNFINYRKL